MREIFLTDLVKNILGPRDGPDEEMVGKTPLTEYITGILAPMSKKKEIEFESEKDLPVAWTEKVEGDEDIDEEIDVSSMLSPALNPEKTPSTMGISFFAESSILPEFEICITWARYLDRTKDNRMFWKRYPRWSVLQIDHSSDNKTIWINSDGKISDKDTAEITIHPHLKNIEGNQYLISFFIVNRIHVSDDEHPTSKHHIFQPQIRVVPKSGTKIVPRKYPVGLKGEEAENEFLYRDRPFLARGHLTSAIWREIDPEIFDKESESLDFPKTVSEPGLKWPDGNLLQKPDYEKFSKPMVRTEYVPAYSIPAPSWDWHGDKDDVPEWSASKLSEMWDPGILAKALSPFDRQYDMWISKLEKSQHDKSVTDPLIKKCRNAHFRIHDGIELLLKDDDARLAFSFANKAMELQTSWKGGVFTFRPFQLAFILMSIESIVDKNSKFRNVCDLLWVPTGAGKTEAYLFLVMMAVAYRRLRAGKKNLSDRTGSGVSVITRYTLRLLTIQQFRRSISVFAAAEFLRVFDLDKKTRVGWRPSGFGSNANLIWGSTPFSVGLWVGQNVTPNRLESTIRPGTPPRHGALEILEQNISSHIDSGEPAQVIECPACNGVLAIPEMGLQPGVHELHFVIQYAGENIEKASKALANQKYSKIEIVSSSVDKHLPEKYATITLKIKVDEKTAPRQINILWRGFVEKHLSKSGIFASIQSASAARPGYFFRQRSLAQNKKPKKYDFEILCPNPSCPLRIRWVGGSPMGSINERSAEPLILTNSADGVSLDDGNNLKDVQKCFQVSEFVSDRIPIPAYTVDDQIYMHLPTMIVSTVDKFARLPFEPKVAGIFGNIDHHHCIAGYYRLLESHPEPKGRKVPYFKTVPPLQTPDLIIQDELHLIDGPLGSMVGIYESALEMLCKTPEKKIPKYIASTATIKRADDHVLSLFTRPLQIFPPKGLTVDDRFFIVEKEDHQLADKNPGRLYVGVCAPGRGGLTPMVRLWARLAQTAFEHADHPDIDNYWTLTGYFNAVRELAGVRALYRGDIREWMPQLSSNPRPLPEDSSHELSGRTHSNDLPSILGLLNREYPNAPDALFTTSMFGTGVDIPRIGLMLVNGQPKTTSSYIQSTGRVGRSRGALVVTFFRATRPRDLSHYEFFARHHRQLHRYVEPPTVSPFASGTMERALGPVCVSILRNMRRTTTPWGQRGSAPLMDVHSTDPEIQQIIEELEKRSQLQPDDSRKPDLGTVAESVKMVFENWRSHAEKHRDLIYNDYEGDDTPVVLGSPRHEHADVKVVFGNAPQSLREIEEETGFQT